MPPLRFLQSADLSSTPSIHPIQSSSAAAYPTGSNPAAPSCQLDRLLTICCCARVVVGVRQCPLCRHAQKLAVIHQQNLCHASLLSRGPACTPIQRRLRVCRLGQKLKMFIGKIRGEDQDQPSGNDRERMILREDKFSLRIGSFKKKTAHSPRLSVSQHVGYEEVHTVSKSSAASNIKKPPLWRPRTFRSLEHRLHPCPTGVAQCLFMSFRDRVLQHQHARAVQQSPQGKSSQRMVFWLTTQPFG